MKTNKLLINKSHVFNVQDAIDHGVEKAILIYHIGFWLEHNRANNTNFHDGNWWTYNSAEAFALIIPYLKSNKIARLLRELEKDGIILVGNYNKKGYDRTKWYSMPCYHSLFNSEQCIIQNSTMECSDLNNALFKSEQPIPDSKPDSKPDKDMEVLKNQNPKSKSVSTTSAKFEPSSFPTPLFIDKELWVAYHDMRDSKKKPATKDVCKIIVKKLIKFNENGFDANESLENAITNSWTGVFEPNQKQQGVTSRATANNQPANSGLNQLREQAAQQRAQLQSNNAIRTVF